MSHPAQRIRFCTSRDGVRIAYATSGSGLPFVRTPHPMSHLDFDQESPVWRHWLSLFAQRYRLVRYDLRGCGLSDRDHVDFSFEKYVEDLEAVVEAAGVRRFALFGMDGGGATAIAYAARHPERVTHLVLLGCYSRSRSRRGLTAKQLAESELWLKAIELGFELNNPGLLQLYASIRIPSGGPGEFQSFNDLMRAATTPANAANIFRAYFESPFDARDLAAQIQCPTIVFHAREDRAIPFDEGRLLAALIPSARFVPLDSSNHLLVEGEPSWDLFVRELDDFLPAAPAGKGSSTDTLFDRLTARERDVLGLLAQALDNRTIAARLGLSERTVRNNVSTIFSKLEADSRAQVIVRAREAGFGKSSS